MRHRELASVNTSLRAQRQLMNACAGSRAGWEENPCRSNTTETSVVFTVQNGGGWRVPGELLHVHQCTDCTSVTLRFGKFTMEIKLIKMRSLDCLTQRNCSVFYHMGILRGNERISSLKNARLNVTHKLVSVKCHLNNMLTLAVQTVLSL